MKRKIIFSVMLLALTSIITMQSCKKDSPLPITAHSAFTEPEAVAPADGATITISGTTVTLTWASTNADGDAVRADVYFGTSATPPLYKKGNTALTLTVPVVKGLTYHWYVKMIDANGITTTSPNFSFIVFEPIGIFVGTYHTVDEGGYAYDIVFSKKSDNILQTENYWDSGWHAEFTMNFVNNTFNMPLTVFGTSTYSAIESGTIDPATGKMVTTYTIYHPVSPTPVVNETGVHIYTKK